MTVREFDKKGFDIYPTSEYAEYLLEFIGATAKIERIENNTWILRFTEYTKSTLNATTFEEALNEGYKELMRLLKNELDYLEG